MIKNIKSNKVLFRALIVILVVVTVSIIIYALRIAKEYQECINEEAVVYIYPDTNLDSLVNIISPYLINPKAFVKVAKKMNLDGQIKPGRYQLKSSMNYKKLIYTLRNGWETPMMLVLSGNIRGKEKLASILGKKLALDSLDFINFFNDSIEMSRYGVNEDTFNSLIIPNSYQFYWTSSPEKFMNRMKIEYERFWTQERRIKAESLDMTPTEVSTLAAILCEESNYKPEYPIIAGVYLNRLKQGIKLQADPTIKFALKDESIRRILRKHLKVDSPYNTYKHKGLPPGPITIPSITGIDAILNYEKHDYIFFCADPSFNGRHKFAVTLKEHNRNARAYHNALSNR